MFCCSCPRFVSADDFVAVCFCSCNISNINHGLLDLNSDAICGAAFVDVAAVAIALSLPVPLLVPMPSVAQPPLLWPLLVPMPSVARTRMNVNLCLLMDGGGFANNVG